MSTLNHIILWFIVVFVHFAVVLSSVSHKEIIEEMDLVL